MTPCPTCGASNREGGKFCSKCGTSLASGCPACGAQNEPGDAFCAECGTALPATAAPTALPRGGSRSRAPPRLRPLRRPRRLHDRSPRARDAEDVRELLSRYFDTCRRLIELLRRHGREVHRRRGDGRLGHAGRDRGRRRARGSRRARPRRRGRRARRRGRRARPAGAGRRPDGRGRGHARRRGQGMVAGDLVNTASRDPVGRGARARCSSASRRGARREAGDRLRGGRERTS